MSKRGNLFIVSAPSGCGKTTIVNSVLKRTPRLVRSISITTRPPRNKEKIKKDYYFIPEKSFKYKAKKGDFLEWTKNFGYYYGTPKKPVYNKLNEGKDVILTIDVKGATQVKRKIPSAITIFIAPPNLEELSRRLKRRATDKLKEISVRLKIAKKEMAFSKKYNYVIVNDKLKDSIQRLKSIIIAKRCKVDKHRA